MTEAILKKLDELNTQVDTAVSSRKDWMDNNMKHFARHGEDKKTSKYNGWIYLIYLFITWTILYYGGFWDIFI